MHSSAIIPKNLLERIHSSFFAGTYLVITIHINSFWMSLCISYAGQTQDDFPYPDVLIEPSHSYSISLKSCVRLSLPSLSLKPNPWRARKRIYSITFMKYSFGKTLIIQIIDRHFQYITTLRHYGFICNCSSWWSANASRAFFQLLNPFVI